MCDKEIMLVINDYTVELYELKQGFKYEKDSFRCLLCEKVFFIGDIYTVSNRLVDAKKAIELHIKEEHSSVFNELISEGKKITGLTENQRDLMAFFHKGFSDKEIALITNTSPSTVRFQRFSLKEKAKQAKVFLSLYELMEERTKDESMLLVHNGATMVDERYNTTKEEEKRIIDTFFVSLDPPVLKSFSPKEKNKLVILKVISEGFEKDKRYEEKEVNEILKSIYDDYVTVRRYLIEYGFMERTKDCKEYWVK